MNKGEARKARQIRDRTFVDELRSRGEIIPDDFLAHVAPLGWEHITFNGDYIWAAEPLRKAFRPPTKSPRRLSRSSLA